MLNLFYPPAAMVVLGFLSDIASDLMPEFWRPAAHVLFTWLLN